MTNPTPLGTLEWLVKHFRRAATENPEPHVEQDAKEVEDLSVAFSGMLTVLKGAIEDWPQMATDEPINGGDMVDWFCLSFHEKATDAVTKATGRRYPDPDPDGKIQAEIDMLNEIADGAWGDNPALRGAARDRIKVLEAKLK